MPSQRTPPGAHNDPAEIDRQVERLSEDLKTQVRRAKDRISGAYGKLTRRDDTLKQKG